LGTEAQVVATREVNKSSVGLTKVRSALRSLVPNTRPLYILMPIFSAKMVAAWQEIFRVLDEMRGCLKILFYQ